MQVQAQDIVFLVILTTCIFLIAAFFLFGYVVLYNKKKRKHFEEKEHMQQAFNQQLSQSRMEVQEATMSSLGKELHDNVCQLLSSSKLLIAFSMRNLQEIPPTLKTADETISQAITSIRSLSKSLDKEWLEQFNLIENLHTEIDRVNATSTARVFFSCPENLSLKTDQQIMLFRIIQEGMQNALKHAGATDINITLSETPEHVMAAIADNGKGFNHNGENNKKGSGLLNIRSRTNLLGGNAMWDSTIGQGTSLTIKIPSKSV
ncbi:MAG: hypothetical protein J0I41_02365 [Filimonas sp.]|nr:hypothetical protein [Filimonas sp.]